MMPQRCVRFSAYFVALQLCAVAPPAFGALLSFVETQVDGASGVEGLAQPSGVVVSSDGRHVYAASMKDAAVAAFERNASSGRLTFIGTAQNGQAGVQGLGGAAALALSPDGAHLYVAGSTDAAVAVFARDADTGQLSFVEAQTNGANDVIGLTGTTSLTVSPDGRNVYVTARTDNALVVFHRDPGTGALTFVEAHVNGVDGVDWLSGAIAVVVSPDGADVYVAAYDAPTLNRKSVVAMLRRNATTGALSFTGELVQGLDGIDGLTRPNALALPPDGTQVYVASFDEDITVFDRDAATGVLTFVQNDNVLPGGPKALTVSPDGARLYVTSLRGAPSTDELNVFTRVDDGTVCGSGGPCVFETYADGVNAQGVNGASGVAVSPDSQHVYVAGRLDNALAVFANTDVTPTPSATVTVAPRTPTPSATLTPTRVALPQPTPSPSTSPLSTATPSPSPPPPPTASPTLAPVACTGDCGLDGEVTVNELLVMVNIALGSTDVSACPAGDSNQDGFVTIDEILKAVNNALAGC